MLDNYNSWYEKHGVEIEDETKAWIRDIPSVLDINDILDDVGGFITSTLRDAYRLYVEENEHFDNQADVQSERELLEGYCF